MGRITIFTQPNCKYCDKLLSVLSTLIERMRDELAAVKPAYGIDIVTHDVSKDLARSAQCRKLSRAHTVPQVFFNAEHVGNSGSCTVFSKCGELRRRLLQLAAQPHTGLPAPEASLVKVDAGVAFSSQPTTAQLCSLGSFGFKTLVCLTHPDELGAEATEGAIATRTGMVYLALPPPLPARVSSSHVEVDLMPHLPETCTEADCPEEAPQPASPRPCVSSPRMAPTARAAAAFPPIIAPAARMGFSSDRTASHDSVSSLADLPPIPVPGSTARRRSSSVSSEDVVGLGEGGDASPALDGRSMVSGLTGVSDLSGRDVWTLDGADLAGREPGEDAWTVEWFASAVAAVQSADKPVLVHDTTGVAACAVALAQAAATLGADIQQVMTWARTLGHDVEEHADLATALQAFLAPSSPDAASASGLA